MDFLNILLADDHQLFRQGLLSLITASDLNARVEQVDTGLAAWDYIRAHRPDIAVLDISMGDMSGIDVARLVHRYELNTKIIFLTMHNDQKIFHRAIEAHCVGYLLKDEAFDQLMIAIHAVGKGEIFVSPAMEQKTISEAGECHKYQIFDELLTVREKEIVSYIAKGHTNKSIAESLFISAKTVDRHRTNLMKKLNIHNTAQIVKYAINEKLDV